MPGTRSIRGLRLPDGRGGMANLAGLAAFIRARLGEVGDSLMPLLVRRNDCAQRALPAGSGDAWLDEARQTIVSAAAPFAPTSFARARLLRQMHACGLLSEDETDQAETLLGVAR
ncbi:MAG TPA: hypothetical protein VGH30_04835 [Jatrophihabitantaceae bacterium]